MSVHMARSRAPALECSSWVEKRAWQLAVALEKGAISNRMVRARRGTPTRPGAASAGGNASAAERTPTQRLSNALFDAANPPHVAPSEAEPSPSRRTDNIPPKTTEAGERRVPLEREEHAGEKSKNGDDDNGDCCAADHQKVRENTRMHNSHTDVQEEAAMAQASAPEGHHVSRSNLPLEHGDGANTTPCDAPACDPRPLGRARTDALRTPATRATEGTHGPRVTDTDAPAGPPFAAGELSGRGARLQPGEERHKDTSSGRLTGDGASAPQNESVEASARAGTTVDLTRAVKSNGSAENGTTIAAGAGAVVVAAGVAAGDETNSVATGPGTANVATGSGTANVATEAVAPSAAAKDDTNVTAGAGTFNAAGITAASSAAVGAAASNAAVGADTSDVIAKAGAASVAVGAGTRFVSAGPVRTGEATGIARENPGMRGHPMHVASADAGRERTGAESGQDPERSARELLERLMATPLTGSAFASIMIDLKDPAMSMELLERTVEKLMQRESELEASRIRMRGEMDAWSAYFGEQNAREQALQEKMTLLGQDLEAAVESAAKHVREAHMVSHKPLLCTEADDHVAWSMTLAAKKAEADRCLAICCCSAFLQGGLSQSVTNRTLKSTLEVSNLR